MSEGQSFDLRLNNEIHTESDTRFQPNVRSSQINATSHLFLQVLEDKADNQSRGGNSEGNVGYVSR